MQIKCIPLRNDKGLNAEPNQILIGKNTDTKQRALRTYGKALGERLVSLGLDNSARITITTTQHDLDNLTYGVIQAIQCDNYALNIGFVNKDNKIEAFRHHSKGVQDILILPIHIINNVHILRKLIKCSFSYANYSKIYLVTPVLCNHSVKLMQTVFKSYGNIMEVITLHIDTAGKYQRFTETNPILNDMKQPFSKFMLESLRNSEY